MRPEGGLFNPLKQRLRAIAGLPAMPGLPMRGLPPHLPNLLAYLHAHRP